MKVRALVAKTGRETIRREKKVEWVGKGDFIFFSGIVLCLQQL